MAYTELTTAPVTYCPGFIANPDAIYEALLAELPWHRNQIFGKPTPRDEVWIAPACFTYGGRTRPAYDGWTPGVLAIKSMVEAATGVTFNSVLCNLYRDQNDSVGVHCDCGDEMSPNHPIASVSLGAERIFRMKSQDGNHKEQITLANGSLLIMHAGMQQAWDHEVPKQKTPCGGRINLTFRVMTKV